MPGASAPYSGRYRALAIARERSRVIDVLMDASPAARCHVPPGSTPLHELAHAGDHALTLPKPATLADEITYLRCVHDPARLVRQALRHITGDPEAADSDVMIAVAVLRDETAQLGDDAYEHDPEPTLQGGS